MTRLTGMVIASALAATAQMPALQPVAKFPMAYTPLTIEQTVQPAKPFTVAGEQGAILGEQDGGFEFWLWPVKVLSHFSITAELADYPVPIDVRACAADRSDPGNDHHHVFARCLHDKAADVRHARRTRDRGHVVLFEIASVRPMRLHLPLSSPTCSACGRRRTSERQRGVGGERAAITCSTRTTPSFPRHIAMPRARPGILPPYQERPKTYPVEFKLAFRSEDRIPGCSFRC